MKTKINLSNTSFIIVLLLICISTGTLTGCRTNKSNSETLVSKTDNKKSAKNKINSFFMTAIFGTSTLNDTIFDPNIDYESDFDQEYDMYDYRD